VSHGSALKADTIEHKSQRLDDIKKKIEQAVKQQRMQHVTSEDSRALDGIQQFLISAQIPPVTVKSVMHEAALAIYRTFMFQEISIGLKSESDGRYRYMEFLGLPKPIEEALRKLSYDLDEFFNQRDYPSIWLSKVTELCITEENPQLEIEKDTYDPATFLGRVRKSPDEFIEGDYFDISMFDMNGVLVGWIEISKPLRNKMPSIQAISRLELFASVLSVLLQKTILEQKHE